MYLVFHKSNKKTHKMEGFWGILYVPASLGHIAADISTRMRVILHVMVLYSQFDIHAHTSLGEQRQAQTCRWKWWQVKASKEQCESVLNEGSDRMTSCCDYKRERERERERERDCEGGGCFQFSWCFQFILQSRSRTYVFKHGLWSFWIHVLWFKFE